MTISIMIMIVALFPENIFMEWQFDLIGFQNKYRILLKKKIKKDKLEHATCAGSNLFNVLSIFFNRADVWKIIKGFIKGLIKVCNKQVQQPFTADVFQNSLNPWLIFFLAL